MKKSNSVLSNKTVREAIIWERCKRDKAHFVNRYSQILDSVTREWVPFVLWNAQAEALATMQNQFVVVLKARQVGLTWLALADALHECLFNPVAEVLLFSKREKEAVYILGRLKGMYNRLPEHMRVGLEIDSRTQVVFENGSSIRALPTDVEASADSYTATMIVVDEADLCLKLGDMLRSIVPAAEAGGRIMLISRVNKWKPNSAFKRVYQDARLGKNNYSHYFIGWHEHPNRDDVWYERISNDLISAGSIDDLHEQYPATPEEALARGYQGRVYPNWSFEENVSEEATYDPSQSVYWSVDDGYTDPRSIGLWQVRYVAGKPDRIVRFAEYQNPRETATQAIEAVLAMGYAEPDIIYYDPAAVQFAAVAINDYGFQCIAGYNKVNDGIKVVRRFIHDGNKERRLLVHPSCEYFIECMSNYGFSDTDLRVGGDPKPIHDEYSHGADDARYFIATRYLIE